MFSKSIYFIAILCIVCVSSCNKNNTIVYETPKFPKHSDLEISPLNTDYLFRYACRILVYDSLLIVGTLNEENHIAIFNRHSGNLITEFGKKGDGPKDLIIPTEYSIDYSKGKMYVNDYGHQAILAYNINDIVNEEVPSYKKINFSHSFKMLNKILFLKDSLFVSPNYSCRYSIASPKYITHNVNTSIGDINKFSEEEWNYFMNEYACHTTSPDGVHFASGSSLGGILELFSFDNKEVKRHALKRYYEPIFKKKGHIYEICEETIGGFSYLNATTKHLYATVFGIINPQTKPTQIWKLDWKGNPIEIFNSNGYPIDCFAVCEEEGLIYAITNDEDGEQIIVKMKIH